MVKLFRYQKKAQKKSKDEDIPVSASSSSIVGGSYKSIKPEAIKSSTPSPSPMSFNTRERLKKFVNLKL